MQEELDAHKKITEAIKDLSQDIKDLRDEVKPVVKWFDNINFAKSFALGLLKLVSLGVGLGVSIKVFLLK